MMSLPNYNQTECFAVVKARLENSYIDTELAITIINKIAKVNSNFECIN